MNMNSELKKRLKQIKEQNYETESKGELFDLTTIMLRHMGSTDRELREELIYPTLANWIETGAYPNEKLKSTLFTLTNRNHLFHKIEESKKQTDAIFMRSYSVLLIPLIITKHKQDPFLSEQEIENVWNHLIKYLQKEKDLRGYVSDKGWAYAMGHAADAVNLLGMCEKITEKNILKMLPVIQSVFRITTPFLFGEEERMVTAVGTLLKKVTPDNKIEWITSFNYKRQETFNPEEDIIIFNLKQFLQSLYFRVLPVKDSLCLTTIEQTLQKLRLQESFK